MLLGGEILVTSKYSGTLVAYSFDHGFAETDLHLSNFCLIVCFVGNILCDVHEI